MWIVTDFNVIRGVKDENGFIREYKEGERLPADYVPHETYIKQGLVKKIAKITTGTKKREVK